MKKNPAFNGSRDRMAPGRLSRHGFLGEDDRPLDEIIAADVAALERHGVTTEQVADLIDMLHEEADAGLETPRRICDGKLTVKLTEVKGLMPCPFACGYHGHKASIQVTAGERTLTVTPMHAHLIREHGFFQGKGSPFRLEPAVVAELVRLCDIAPRTDGDENDVQESA